MKSFGDLYKEKKKKTRKTKSSKEQIIKKAIQFHSEGNISEASKYYEYCLNQRFNDRRVFSNYGVILQNQGKTQQAEDSYRKAIELDPNFAFPYSNLGNILRDQGKTQQAEDSYRKAIELDPNFAIAHCNLGTICKGQGRNKEAESLYRKAIELDSNFDTPYSNLGNLLIDLGKEKEAFDLFIKAKKLNPSNLHIDLSITSLLKNSDPGKFNKIKLKNLFDILLQKNDIEHNSLSQVFQFLYKDEMISMLEKIDSDSLDFKTFIKNKPIINGLKKIIFCDTNLEKTLTITRKIICSKIANNYELNDENLEFISALGEQCFMNEYIYSITEEENKLISKIIKNSKSNHIDEKNIAIISCYRPLYKLLDDLPLLKSFKSDKKHIKELLKLQIIDPLEENKLSKSIKRLGQINDEISKKVKSQYEENPYPRWRYCYNYNSQKTTIEQAINNEIKPNSISSAVVESEIKVLIAGCGTGQQILQSQRYKNAQITAIDLSLPSLSYAKRKINEFRINNVKLIQLDILDVNLLKEQFDIIECAGVLHHMRDPLKGLQALLSVLKQNGYLKLGLYSELARQGIIQAKSYIISNKIQSTEENIRNFRKKIISGKLNEFDSLKNSPDFYSLSMIRDLCFHEQEVRFTIHKLEEIFQSEKLKFLGFSIPEHLKYLYKKSFSEDKEQINLKNWEILEKTNQHIFGGMYQFWVHKI